MKNILPLILLPVIFVFASCRSNPKSAVVAATDSVSSEPAAVKTDSITPDTAAIAKDTAQSAESPGQFETGKVSYVGEQAVIYKTKKDYSALVPVTMNAGKTKIVSYPAPADLYYRGKFAKPFKLKNGYWLDNRGIQLNTVFLDFTYDDYSKLKEAPLLSEMMNRIADKDPFTEIYSLGNRSRFKDEKKEINEIISRNALRKFKKIK